MSVGRMLAAGAIAGLCGAVLLDLYLTLSEPLILKGVTPLIVMQWDASNVLGAAAYRGGWATAALGTLMHFGVSIVWGVIFIFAAARDRWLVDRPVFGGALLGAVAMAVMRGIIHLGHAVVRPFPNAGYFLYIIIAHVIFFGIPVAFVASQLLERRVYSR